MSSNGGLNNKSVCERNMVLHSVNLYLALTVIACCDDVVRYICMLVMFSGRMSDCYITFLCDVDYK